MYQKQLECGARAARSAAKQQPMALSDSPSLAAIAAAPAPQDIHKPDPVRLRRHLSAVINFAKFREEKLVTYAELQARMEGLVDQKRALAEEAAARVSGVVVWDTTQRHI